MKIAIDTNVLVRYLTWDDVNQAVRAAAVIEAADEVHVSTVYFVRWSGGSARAYRYKTNGIVPVIEKLVAGHEFQIDRLAARAGLRFLAAGGDFADGVILNDMRRASCEYLATFDRDFAGQSDSSKVVLLGG